MNISSQLPFAVATSSTFLAAARDRWRVNLHDFMTFPLLAAGLFCHAATGGAAGLMESLLGVLIGSVVLITFYLLGEVDAPEIKLMATVGAWLGLPLGYYVFVAGVLTSGVFALGLMLMNWADGEALEGPSDDRIRIARTGIGYGPDDRAEVARRPHTSGYRAISIGVMVALGISATLVWIRGGSESGWSPPSTCPAPDWPVAPAASLDGPSDRAAPSGMTSPLADSRHPSHPRRNS